MRAFHNHNYDYNYNHYPPFPHPYEMCVTGYESFDPACNFRPPLHFQSQFNGISHFNYQQHRNHMPLLGMRPGPAQAMQPRCFSDNMSQSRKRPNPDLHNSFPCKLPVPPTKARDSLFTDFSYTFPQNSAGGDDTTKSSEVKESIEKAKTISEQKSCSVKEQESQTSKSNEKILSIVGAVSSLDDYADDDDNDNENDKQEVVDTNVNSTDNGSEAKEIESVWPQIASSNSLSPYDITISGTKTTGALTGLLYDTTSILSTVSYSPFQQPRLPFFDASVAGNCQLPNPLYNVNLVLKPVSMQSYTAEVVEVAEDVGNTTFTSADAKSSNDMNAETVHNIGLNKNCVPSSVQSSREQNRPSSGTDLHTSKSVKPQSDKDETEQNKKSQGEAVPTVSLSLRSRLESKISDTKCELCAVLFNSKAQRDQHIAGKKHLKRLKFFEEECSSSDDVASAAPAETPQVSAKENSDESSCDNDVVMTEVDEHSTFADSASFFYRACAANSKDSSVLMQSAFEMFRLMEDYLRFLIRNYVSPGIDPTRMSWNELVTLLRRNTINKLSSALEKKLDLIRQLRNSVVHSCSLSADEQLLSKIFRVAEELLNWGRKFSKNPSFTKFYFQNFSSTGQ